MNTVCALSDLPIQEGEDVYVLLLSDRFSVRDDTCWRVESPLVEGTYTDYGGFDVEDKLSGALKTLKPVGDVEATIESVIMDEVRVTNSWDEVPCRVQVAMFRRDVFDALVPVDAEVLKRANDMRNTASSVVNMLSDEGFSARASKVGVDLWNTLFSSYGIPGHVMRLEQEAGGDFVGLSRVYELHGYLYKVGRTLRPQAARFHGPTSAHEGIETVIRHHEVLLEIARSIKERS